MSDNVIKLEKCLVDKLNCIQPPPTEEDAHARSAVIMQMKDWFTEWLTENKKIPGIAANEMFVLRLSGSFRFHIYTSESDMDILMITGMYFSVHEFFESWGSFLKSKEEVEDVKLIKFTRVPIISMSVNGIEVDLLLAIIAFTKLPKSFHVLDPSVLHTLDFKTMQTLNSARVTEYVVKTTRLHPSFLTLLKSVRLWAKARGLYGAKFGFLGGVQCELLSLFAFESFVQSDERKALFYLRQFFKTYAMVDWSTAILRFVTSLPDITMDEGWVARKRKRDEAMVVLTPTKPYTNTTFNVNLNTILHIQEEFERAWLLLKDISNSKDAEKTFGMLFEPYKLVQPRSFYLKVRLLMKDEFTREQWFGLIESKIRFLAYNIFYMYAPSIVKECYIWPKTLRDDAWILCIRLANDFRQSTLNVNKPVQDFKEWIGLNEASGCILETHVLNASSVLAETI